MKKYSAIVVGTSSGGMDALASLIPMLPKNFSLPIIVVQHLSPTSDDYLSQYLNELSPINVKEAHDKQKFFSGNVYIAPSNYHLLIEREGVFSLSVDDKNQWSRPSIDILFKSAADAYEEKLIGVLLTGGNADGRDGLKSIKEAGGLIIAQDPSQAATPYMPQEAINSFPVDHILGLNEIGVFLSGLHEDL